MLAKRRIASSLSGAWTPYALAALHFFASFLYESVLFVPDSPLVGDSLTVYILSKLFGAALLVLFWRSLYRLVQRSFLQASLIVFFVLFAFAAAQVVVLYPDMYGYELDDLYTYWHAVRYLPHYWHNILTGAVYAGSYMLFPHPIALPLIQSALFCALVAAVYGDLYTRFGKWYAPLALLLIVPAETRYICMQPYRNCMYTILCLYAFRYVLFATLDRERFSWKRMLCAMLAFAFIAVWRGEGVLYLCAFVLLLIFAYRLRWWKVGALTVLALLMIYAAGTPQRIGERLGGNRLDNDYRLVSTMHILQNVLNDPDVNLSYDGAQADLDALEAAVPINRIRQYGLLAYHYTNFSQGRRITNAALTDEQFDAYLSAFVRLCLHNPISALVPQINHYLQAIGMDERIKPHSYSGVSESLPLKEMSANTRAKHELGQAELDKQPAWTVSESTVWGRVHVSLKDACDAVQLWYTRLTAYPRIAAGVFAAVILTLYCAYFSIRQRDWFYILLALVLFGELCAIILAAPEGRRAYYFPIYYVMLLYALVLAASSIKLLPSRPHRMDRSAK